jgi:hypothetical protein
MESEKTVLIAKPYINNNKDIKEFTDKKKAVLYLNSYLLDTMPTMTAEDYFLIGKLYAKDGTTDWIGNIK